MSGGSFPGAVSRLLFLDVSVQGNINNSHDRIVGLYRHPVSKSMTDPVYSRERNATALPQCLVSWSFESARGLRCGLAWNEWQVVMRGCGRDGRLPHCDRDLVQAADHVADGVQAGHVSHLLAVDHNLAALG